MSVPGEEPQARMEILSLGIATPPAASAPSGEGEAQTFWQLLAGWPLALLLVCTACGSSTGWFYWRYHVNPLPALQLPLLPIVRVEDDALVVGTSNGNLLAEVGNYPDDLSAYLYWKYLQSLKVLQGSETLIQTKEDPEHPRYLLCVVLKDDIVTQPNRMLELKNAGYIDGFALSSPPTFEIRQWEKETRLFDAAYSDPVKQRLLQFPQMSLTSAVAKFILFKIRTDRRVREKLEPVEGKTLSAADANEFAADMIAVAKFYDIPLQMLLGIGAMENNYLDVRGDLQHAVWTRHLHHGDIVLKRRGRRYLISNYSIGPWQMTRETLRYVHSLYLKDKRDYTQLPPRLRPPKKLDLDQVDTHVLTTYAGLLLRKLLDDFNGDVAKAQGAYNGGPGNPNAQYSEGVSMVADYAHRVLSMAAGRKGNAVAETGLTTSPH
jgi:hypothetical protein